MLIQLMKIQFLLYLIIDFTRNLRITMPTFNVFYLIQSKGSFATSTYATQLIKNEISPSSK